MEKTRTQVIRLLQKQVDNEEDLNKESSVIMRWNKSEAFGKRIYWYRI